MILRVLLGEKLAKQILKHESTIKSLRATKKEDDSTITSLKERLQNTENLLEIRDQIDQLRLLKNDYGFSHLKAPNSSFIDIRLKEIEQHAYSIFTYYYKMEVIEKEEEGKRKFYLFQEEVYVKCQQLALEHAVRMIQIRFLTMVPVEILKVLLRETIKSINDRLYSIQVLHQNIDEMEKMYEGKFTIPFIHSYSDRIRTLLSNEVRKVKIEAELIISNLILNYQLTPFKSEVKELLDSLHINPEEERSGERSAWVFKETLEIEIERIKLLFKNKQEEK